MIDRSNRFSRQGEFIKEAAEHAATLIISRRVGKEDAEWILGDNYREIEPSIYTHGNEKRRAKK